MKKLFTVIAVALMACGAWAQNFKTVEKLQDIYGDWNTVIDMPSEVVSQIASSTEFQGHSVGLKIDLSMSYSAALDDEDLTVVEMVLKMTLTLEKKDGIDEGIISSLKDTEAAGVESFELSKDHTKLVVVSKPQRQIQKVGNESPSSAPMLISEDGTVLRVDLTEQGMGLVEFKKK
ncbi:MAG: hypothetical protein MJ169_03680 [Treponema sp.]|nr:hypothetical protein [Treponema sp.]